MPPAGRQVQAQPIGYAVAGDPESGVVAGEVGGELYPEIAAVWGLAFAIFLEWEGVRLQPDEIRLGVIVTIVGVFLTRIVAIVRGTKGWSYV